MPWTSAREKPVRPLEGRAKPGSALSPAGLSGRVMNTWSQIRGTACCQATERQEMRTVDEESSEDKSSSLDSDEDQTPP